MKNMNKAAAAVLSAAMIIGSAMPVYASKYDDPISSLDINIEYELSSSMTKDDIEVSCDTDGVDAISISSFSGAEYGKKPTLVLKVKADTGNGYYFDADDASEFRRESAFNFTGDEVTYSSSKRSSNSNVTVTVRLPKIGEDGEGLEIGSVNWDGDTGIVSWDEAEDATKYSVKLLKGTSTKNTFTTTKTSYDFSSEIRGYGTGSYTVRVKAYNGNHSGEWEETSEFDVDTTIMNGLNSNGSSSGSASSGGAWLKDSNGTWYCNADRSYTTNNWQQIDGYWYHFDSVGYVQTGWFQSPTSGLWYYLSKDPNCLGRMETNKWIDGYYVNNDGVWQQ